MSPFYILSASPWEGSLHSWHLFEIKIPQKARVTQVLQWDRFTVVCLWERPCSKLLIFIDCEVDGNYGLVGIPSVCVTPTLYKQK